MPIGKYPAEVHGDSPLQDVLTWRIHIVHAKLNAHAAKFLEGVSGIPLVHWRVMLTIGENGSTTHSAIHRKILMDKGQLSRCLKAMIEDGLVTTHDDEADQRQQRLSLTKKGLRIFRKTLPEMRSRQNFLIGELSKIERKSIFSALDKLERAAGNFGFAA